MYDNLRKVCIQNVKRRYLKPEGNKKIEIGYEFQAKKFPCYKDIQKLWHFDFVDEERKRFEMLKLEAEKAAKEEKKLEARAEDDLIIEDTGFEEEEEVKVSNYVPIKEKPTSMFR